KTAPRTKPTMRPRRYRAPRRPRRMPTAYTAATAKPVARYAEDITWMVSIGVPGLKIACSGCTSVTRPPTRRKPLGLFIQALAVTTNHADAAPLTVSGTAHTQCARGDSRSQP